MSKALVRILAVLLVPCLIAEPSLADSPLRRIVSTSRIRQEAIPAAPLGAWHDTRMVGPPGCLGPLEKTIQAARGSLAEAPSTATPRRRVTVPKLLIAGAVVGAAAAFSVSWFVRRQLRGASKDVMAMSWPLKISHALYLWAVDPMVALEGAENIPPGSFSTAGKHASVSGADGYLIFSAFASRFGRLIKILVTADPRIWYVDLERSLLAREGIMFLVHLGTHMTETIARFMKENDGSVFLFFPAGLASDTQHQMEGWQTGVIAVASYGFPIIPCEVSGLPPGMTPWEILMAGVAARMQSNGRPPFRFLVRFGPPIYHDGTTDGTMKKLQSGVLKLQQRESA